MSWLLFLDESGHDHKHTPYEVRGGIALHAGDLWSFVQGVQRLELDSFGCRLHQYRCELKGSTLLDRKRFTATSQTPTVRDAHKKEVKQSEPLEEQPLSRTSNKIIHRESTGVETASIRLPFRIGNKCRFLAGRSDRTA
jgi:hypothetical protein